MSPSIKFLAGESATTAISRARSAGFLRHPIIAVVVCLGLGVGLIGWRSSARTAAGRSRAQSQVQATVAKLEVDINRALSVTTPLAMFVRQANGRPSDFQKIGAELLKSYPGLVTLELLPGGVTSDVVSRANNEKVVGHNLTRYPAARQAAQAHKLVVIGPLMLPRGEPGIIGLLPVFLPAGKGPEALWGFVAASLGLSDNMFRAGLTALADQGYDYRFVAVAPPPAKPVLIVKHGDPGSSDVVQKSMIIANLELSLAVRPSGSWVSLSPLLLDSIALIFFAALLGLWLQTRMQNGWLLADSTQCATRLAQEKEHSAIIAAQLFSAQTTHNAELRSIQGTVETIQAKLHETETELLHTRDGSDSIRKELQNIRERAEAELREAQRAKASLLAQLNETTIELQQDRKRIAQLEEELRVACENSSRAEETANKSAGELHSTLSILEQENKVLKATCETEQAKRREIESQLRLCQEQRDQLEEELRLAHNKLEKAAQIESELLARLAPPQGAGVQETPSTEPAEPSAKATPEETAAAAPVKAGADSARVEPTVPKLAENPSPASLENLPSTASVISLVPTAMETATAANAESTEESAPASMAEAETNGPSKPKPGKSTRPKKKQDSAQLNLFAAESAAEPVMENSKLAQLPGLNRATFKKTAGELYLLLAESDPGAIDCLADCRLDLKPAFAPEAFETFEKMTKNSAFPEALELLIKTARRHGINL